MLKLTLLVFFWHSFAFADSATPDETSAAIDVVQQQMQSPEFHKTAAANSADAKQVEVMIKEMAGSDANEQAMYQFAAEILGNMKGKTPEQMKALLEQAQSNPEAFAKSWTPEQRKKLQNLSNSLPAAHQKNP